jgi:hypothetical protein
MEGISSNRRYQYAVCNGRIGVSYKLNRHAFKDIRDCCENMGHAGEGECYFIDFQYLWSRPCEYNFVVKESQVEVLGKTVEMSPVARENGKIFPALCDGKYGVVVTTQRAVADCLDDYPFPAVS